jgi:transposase
MRVLYERCAAVDAGKDVIAVAARWPGDAPDGRQTVKRTFKTFYGVLREAARWLSSLGVTHVAMEATGIYSMPVCHALIEHGGFAQVLVCNAGHVKNAPGRKTDLADAGWLADLLECGLLRGSFIPPADIKAARDVFRYRTKVVQARTSEVQRLGAVLQDAGIKIDSVASSIATKSGRAMIEALIDGERRPRVRADLAQGKRRAKIPDLALALEGRFGDHHALMCRLHLDHIDHLDAMITKLDTQIETMMVPFRAARDLLTTAPGIGPLAAAGVISEIGAGPAAFFATAPHLASWAGLCPGNHESAGKRHHGRRRHGNQHRQSLLAECAWSAVRHDGYLKSRQLAGRPAMDRAADETIPAADAQPDRVRKGHRVAVLHHRHQHPRDRDQGRSRQPPPAVHRRAAPRARCRRGRGAHRQGHGPAEPAQ